jgi:Bacterial conjugation TrbI-like protein
MKRLLQIKNLIALLALFFLVGALPAAAQHRRPVVKRKVAVKKRIVHPAPLYVVTTGTTVRSRINETLNSKSARIGDTFTANVTEPVYSTNGVIVIPVGSVVTGRVDSVKPAGKSGNPGQISVSFTNIRLPNGRTHAINGSLTDLEGKTSSDNESTASGKKMGNRNLIFIGGGTAGGAVLGAAIGGGKGALIGGLLGAGGGFLGQKLTKGPEAEVRSGTEFGVYLNQAISLPKFGETVTP